VIITPFVGGYKFDFSNILDKNSLDFKIFFDIRLPREIFTFFAGFILSLAGFIYQNIFRNKLVTPYTLGISSGAVLGAGIGIKLGVSFVFLGISAINLFGFLGAFLSVIVILFFAKYLKDTTTSALLLLGIALSFFYTSSLMIVFYLGDTIQNDMLLRFSMGSLSIVGWNEPLVVLVSAVIFFIVVYIYRYELNFIALSNQLAVLKGVEVKKVIYAVLLVSSFAIGVLISISGPIGFVGLVVPHIVSKIFQTSFKHRILLTSVFGGVFLLFCDTISRVIQTQNELPVGIVTAFIGALFFIYLILKR
jgi:iron complex transport system permease protein